MLLDFEEKSVSQDKSEDEGCSIVIISLPDFFLDFLLNFFEFLLEILRCGSLDSLHQSS